jgi:exodeoxyribonuclease X
MTILIFDTETAHLHGDIIQAAYMNIEISNGRAKCVSRSTVQNYMPDDDMDFEAMAIHNIIPSDLAFCPPHTMCRIPGMTDYIIGHNIDYDMDALKRSGQTCNNVKRICTLAIMRYLYPDLPSHKLGVLCYRFSDNLVATRSILKAAHNALADCHATLMLIEHIIKVQDIQNIEELYQLSEKARYPTHFYWGRKKGQKIADTDTDELLQILRYEKDPYLTLSIETVLKMRQTAPEKCS